MPDVPDFSAAPWRQDDTLAIAQAGRALTYAELSAHAAERARQLAVKGLAPGQVVMAPDLPAWDLPIMQHSLARLGAALFPFRADLPASELTALERLVAAEWRWRPESGCLQKTGQCPPQAAGSEPSDVRVLIKTSGSSGGLKAVMLTGGNLLASARAANQALGLARGDLWLTCLRLSHIGGLAICYRCALAGAAVLIHDGFDAAAVARDLGGRPVTHLSLVPPMLARLLDLGVAPPALLRVLLVGGQAVSTGLARRALEAGWPLHLTYGMTETGSQIAVRPAIGQNRLDTTLAGEPLPGVELDGAHCDEAGRLRVRGPMVMAGYAGPDRRPGRGLEPGGWLATSDLGCLTAEGQLRVLGRADDVLVIGGVNVSRAAVERRVSDAPGVRDSVVVGIPEPIWGFRVAVAYQGDVDEAGLEQWCRSHLPSAGRPRDFLRLEALPLLASGKYDRVRIASMLKGLVLKASSGRPGEPPA
ncbi:AMP-binding protein [Thiorhodococcus minor]|uniref:AMP-binding protein n=2 Tax=Thiorhodococcus minor TaxID=57489 RepID=A0A6M0K478_9GAMM|nr:AMP-binding protein [Thiorhodococcus minor]